ncbi:MAG: hypothetical protein AAF456_15470 [Planctomycetota bacterium]
MQYQSETGHPEETPFGKYVAATTAGNQASQVKTIKLIISFILAVIMTLYFLPEQEKDSGAADSRTGTSQFSQWSR